MTTKKLLVSFDTAHPDRATSDFLVPIEKEGHRCFLGLQSKKEWAYGTMVYIGREITEKDVFARLVDTGRKIDGVRQTIEAISTYLRQLQEHKIGNVLGIEPSADEPCGFKLNFIAITPHAAMKILQ